MGSTVAQPHYSDPDFILDFRCNLFDPNNRNLLENLGPLNSSFPQQAKCQIIDEMKQCLDINESIRNEYAQYLRNSKIVNIFIYIAMFIFISLIIFIAIFAVVLLVISMIVCIVVLIMVNKKAKALGNQWRNSILAELQTKLQQWHAQYPAFTFSIIYPMEIKQCVFYGSCMPQTVALWIYLRITIGPCKTALNQPIFATTTNLVVQTKQVVIQQPLQVKVQQFQTPMVRGPDGQLIAGRYAMHNGKQIIIVNQPQYQQVQNVQQPLSSGEQQTYTQVDAYTPMETPAPVDAYTPIEASAPVEYNPEGQ